MKSFITAMIITVIMIAGCIVHTWHLAKTSETMIMKNHNAVECIENSDFDTALDHINEIQLNINKRNVLLSAIIDHSEIDKIQRELSEMEVYTRNHNKADALAKASALNVCLEHLPKNYKLKIENIL